MPLRRKYAPRRRLIRRKQMTKYRNLRARGLVRAPRNPGYHFKRTWFSENYFSTGSTGPTLAGLNFQLDQMPNASEFTNLFDVYRVNKVVVKIIPKITEVGIVNGSTGNSTGIQVHSAIDYDDSGAPASIAQLTQYNTYKMTRGNQIHTRVFVPKCQLNAGGSQVAPKAYQWLDTGDRTVPHMGMKLIIPTISPSTIVYYDYSVTMYFSCKSTI